MANEIGIYDNPGGSKRLDDVADAGIAAKNRSANELLTGEITIGTGNSTIPDASAGVNVNADGAVTPASGNTTQFDPQSTAEVAVETLTGGAAGEFGGIVFPHALRNEGLRPVAVFHCLGGRSHDKGRITFPAPSSFIATDGAEYGSQEMGFLAKKATDAISSVSNTINQNGAEASINNIKDMVSNVTGLGFGGASKKVGDFVGGKFDQFKRDKNNILGGLAGAAAVREISKGSDGALGLLEAVPGMDGFASGTAIALGITVNKNITTEFSGVATRTFSFNYELVPSNREEGQEIDRIIKIFTRAIYPSKQNFGAVLRYPPKWEITFDKRIGGSPLTTYPTIAQCYLTSFQTTYNQNNSFHDDGTPVKTAISLSFKEDRALTVEDIDDLQRERNIDSGIIQLRGRSPFRLRSS